MKTFVVTGVGEANGLGAQICDALSFMLCGNVKIIAICEPGKAPEGAIHQFFSCDLTKPHDTYKLLHAIGKDNPKIDGLIHCAGISKMDWFPDLDYGDFLDSMSIGVGCLIPIIQGIGTQLSGGTILNIVSVGADRPYTTAFCYNTSKAALKMATLQLARELSVTHDISVFGISPSQLDGTPMTVSNDIEIIKKRGWTQNQIVKAQKTQSINGERIPAKDLAEYIAYLLSSKKNHKHFSGTITQYGTGV